jgi:arginine-tRNA-protein transferase
MKHKPIHDTRFFFATAPLPCPYLPGRMERRVVTELVGRDAVALHDALSLAGFRRSHGIVYAPACVGCSACVPVRVIAGAFERRRSHRRVWNANADLIVKVRGATATKEQYALFSLYQHARHGGGDMAKMDFADYQALIEDTPIDTAVVEFRDPAGRLVAACLMDRIESGLSAVYSFFDPNLTARSLGTYMILWLIEHARATGRRYVYLGFWIGGCSKMSYKAMFKPLEARMPGGWRPLDLAEGDRAPASQATLSRTGDKGRSRKT